MSTPNSLVTERIALAGVLTPQTIDDDQADSSWVDAGRFGRLAFVISLGAIGVGATVNVALLQATDDQGADAAAIAGKALDPLGPDAADHQAVIELRTSELSAGFTHVACRVTVADATAVVSVTALGADGRFLPAHAWDHAGVIQRIA